MDIVTGLLLLIAFALGVVLSFAWLTMRQQHVNRELASMRNQHREALQQGQQWQQQLHEIQVREGRLESELENARSNYAQAQDQLEVSHAETLDMQQRLENRQQAQVQTERQLEKITAIKGGLESQLDELKSQQHKSEALLTQKQDEHLALLEKYTRLKSGFDEREQSHQREVANFAKQAEMLKDQFKSISNDILDSKSKTLQETSQTTLTALMTPFQKSLNEFKQEVQGIHRHDTEQQGKLHQELKQLKELNQQITAEAHDLSTALRGQKKLQGNWGELILENVLDRSGLVKDKDYAREVSFNTEEGRQRPDAIVYLPQNKHLVIDAKVSLNAYTRYVNAEDEQARALALKEHVAAMRGHIKELSQRRYDQIKELDSPAITFMFVPIESAFVEALKADEALFQKAIEDNVLVATPTTLLTSLNIVRQLWRYEKQNKHTAELAKKAEGVFNKLNSFLKSFERVKKGIDTAADAYAQAERQLVNGRGNLVKQVNDFKKLAPAIEAQLPEHFAEKADLELDYAASDDQDIQSAAYINNEDSLKK